MKLRYTDFNGAEVVLSRGGHLRVWAELRRCLKLMPLHLKPSDQAGIVGRPVFDAVGTNQFIKRCLEDSGWRARVPLPAEYSFLGTDVDFGKRGVAVEVQFSNYPFLLNNLMRAELLHKARVPLTGQATAAVVIVAKARMFPAAQSTLYYEQAVGQVKALAEAGVIDAPIRVAGLFEEVSREVAVKWTTYLNPRYSRTVVTQEDRLCRIEPGRTTTGRHRITLL